MIAVDLHPATLLSKNSEPFDFIRRRFSYFFPVECHVSPLSVRLWHPIHDRFLNAANGSKGSNNFPYFGTDCGCKVIDALDGVGNTYTTKTDLRLAFVLCNHCSMHTTDEQKARILRKACRGDHLATDAG